MYGAAGQDWINEQSEPNPITPYGMSKWKAEVDLRRLADAGFSPVFLRSATAYGFSPRIRFDLVLNNLTAHAFTSGKVLLKSDGMSWRPIVHIEDIGRAFLAALEASAEIVHSEIFNVGITTENYRIRELAEIVEETVPGSRIEFAIGAGADKPTYRIDCSKISRLLPNFRPQWTARRGARDLYNRYTEHGLLLEDFEGARYQCLGYLQSLMARGAVTAMAFAVSGPTREWSPTQPTVSLSTLASIDYSIVMCGRPLACKDFFCDGGAVAAVMCSAC